MEHLSRKYDYHARTKNTQINHDPYGHRHTNWNEPLKAAFAALRNWRLALFNTDRPRRLYQRPTTFDNGIPVYENYFGYLIRFHQDNPDGLRLAVVADPKRVLSFAEWHVKQRTDGQPSRYLERTIGEFCRTARDYLKAPAEQWEELLRLRQAVVPDTKRDKWRRTVSLATLEAIGLAEKPNLEELAAATTDYAKAHLALRAQRSLYIRLLVYRPLRNRNLREMKVDDNLYRNGRGWMIEFKGMELKVGRRNGRTNLYRLSWPEDLVPELEEFLKVWRPLLSGQARSELFISRYGQPYIVFGLKKSSRRPCLSTQSAP